MPALLESPPNAISFNEVAAISRSLAEDLGQLKLRTEGFTEADYLQLDGNYFVEYIDGRLQVLPMPDLFHQAIVFVLGTLLSKFVQSERDARVALAPFKVKLRDGQYREPDIGYMSGAHASRRTRTHWNGADLVVEIVSRSNRDHDWITKRKEYAINGIPEYWIVDPDQRSVTVLTLQSAEYNVAGEYRDGQSAPSALLKGFAVDVRQLFDDALAAS